MHKRLTFFHKLFLGIFFLINLTYSGLAQEYTFEIGGMAGSSFYMGDLNKTVPFKNIRPAVGAMFRYNANFRMAMKANVTWGMISGTTEGLKNAFPQATKASFERHLLDVSGQFEFNFLPYSDLFAYKNTSRFTPYIFIGGGLTYAPGDTKDALGIHIPLGVGIKYKLKNRLNIGCEFSMRKLFIDDLDVTNEGNKWLNDPYQMKGSVFKNKDWYSFFVCWITWDFGSRNKKCNHIDNY